MFRLVSNIVASFIRTATLAQRLDDAVSFADGQSDCIKDLELELAYAYRRIEHMRFELDKAEAAYVAANREWSDSDEQMGIITDDNAALRRSLAEMRSERDALKNEVATLRAAATQRAAGYDSDPYDGLSPADR